MLNLPRPSFRAEMHQLLNRNREREIAFCCFDLPALDALAIVTFAFTLKIGTTPISRS